MLFFNTALASVLIDTSYRESLSQVNTLVKLRCVKWEADTIQTDFVPSDAIPTIHCQDDPVHV